MKDLQLFARKLILKSLHSKHIPTGQSKPSNDKALDELISLLEDQESTDLIDQLDILN